MKSNILLVLFCILTLTFQAQTTYTFTEGLVAGPCHQYWREALFTDLLAHQLIQGKLDQPTEGVFWQSISREIP